MKKILALFIIVMLAFSANISAQSSITKMQSLYMYNFIKNIKWSNVSDRYVIGVFAEDEAVKEISSVLASRDFNGKSITVKKISTSAEASSCHLVFVSATNSKNIKSMSNTKNTLIVSEKGQINNGASIAFILEDSKLKFKINEAACKASDLQISPTLLALGV